jgi:ligand-binding sensor domain-containing protein/serine phosphatase RsbU (regulator of sigma subunit)
MHKPKYGPLFSNFHFQISIFKFQVSIFKFPFSIFLFLLLSGSFAFSQTYSFDNYTVQDGIVQSNVAAMVQDKNGDIWLGTGSGVSRFNGKTFTNYSTDDSLADNNVTAMLLDKKGNIWFGHANGGLSIYDGKAFRIVHSNGLPKDRNIFSLCQDTKGHIWICTAQYGAIEIIDPEGNLSDAKNYKGYTSKDGLSEFCFGAFDDERGKMWFLTDVGIKQMDRSSGKFEFFRPQHPLPATRVTSFFRAKDGAIWFGFADGNISVMSPAFDSMDFTSADGLPGNSIQAAGGMGMAWSFVNAFMEDNKGNVWAAIWDRGIVRFNGIQKKPFFSSFSSSNGLSVNKVKSLACDREGNILIGTLGNGLAVFKGEKFISYNKTNGLINNQVWSVLQDKKGRYWWGTNEGITIYDPAAPPEKRFINISKLTDGSISNSVRSMAADRAGNIWIGTWGGKVVMYDLAKEKFVLNPVVNDMTYSHVSCIAVDKKNCVWIGTPEGITFFDIDKNSARSYRTVDGLSSNDVTCIFPDSKGNIWLGTKQRGITKFKDGKFTKFDKTNGLSYPAISCITENKRGEIWIGTEGGGVFLYHSNSFSNFKTKDGLNSDFITLLNVDENNNVWIGSNNGLNRFDYATNMFSSYTSADGFTGIETKNNATYTDAQKNIWFGTVNGVYKYNPAGDVKNTLEPIVKITGLKVNLKDYPLSDTLELSYKENSINIEYIGICMSNPEAVQYSVMLEGYDEGWRPATKQSFEIYSNLPPGHYVFKLTACNNSGLWTEHPVSVYINITPPFWKRWWFYVLCFVTGAGIIIGYIKWRERALLIEKRVLEEKVEVRTAEIADQKKEIEEKNKDITASIRYAKRIQDAILPPDTFVKTYLPKTFVLFKPKDIVSGDFYWLSDKKDKILFAAVDCTGHGVPGAFMSIVGHNLLDKIVVEQGLTKPSEILDALNKSVSDTLRQSNTEGEHVKDGMDIALCAFDRNTQTFEYAGAFNPLWLIREGQLIETKGDKFPIGNLHIGEQKKFTNHEIPLQKGDTLYIFSDGFADQFGGKDGKKLKYAVFKNMLLSIQHMSMEEQGAFLGNAIDEWRGELEQVDDILVIGTRL